MFEFKILHAGSGDSIFITYVDNKNKKRNILIDGGSGQIYKKVLRNIFEDLDQLDLLIVTHIDLDHIGGINKLLESNHKCKIKNIFFNSASLLRQNNSNLISIDDGIKLTEYIEQNNIKIYNDLITMDKTFEIDGLSIKFLSPTMEALEYLERDWKKKEEKNNLISSTMIMDERRLSEIGKDDFKEKKLVNDVANWSSLAFEMRYKDKVLLLLGDAKDSVIVFYLRGKKYTVSNKYKVDFVKLSHHGSKYNTSNEFLSLIETNHFIFSTNGTYNHPNIETIARILSHPHRKISDKIYLYFNYPKEEYVSKGIRLLTNDEETEYNCKSIYDEAILTLKE